MALLVSKEPTRMRSPAQDFYLQAIGSPPGPSAAS